jgi:hypothetical protein
MERYRNEFKGFYEEGVADGRAKGRAESVLSVLAGRGLPVSDALKERVLRCQDAEQLQRWLLRAITVSSAEEILQDR